MDLFSKSEVPSLCLHDVERTDAFRAAINKVDKPGDVALDAGTGIGILPFFAPLRVHAHKAESIWQQRLVRNGNLGAGEHFHAVDVLFLALPEVWTGPSIFKPVLPRSIARKAINKLATRLGQ